MQRYSEALPAPSPRLRWPPWRISAPGAGGGRASTSGDRVTLDRTTLLKCIDAAFGPNYGINARDQVVGPDWILTERYDIAAKAPEHTPAEQVPGMLQTLLVERFQLKLHHETRDLPGYVLALGKGRLKLEEVKDPLSLMTGRAESAPSVFDIPDGLGLSLEARKAPFAVIVIDSGNKVPLEN